MTRAAQRARGRRGSRSDLDFSGVSRAMTSKSTSWWTTVASYRMATAATVTGVRAALRPGGHLVFETRDPEQRAWREWNREASLALTYIDGVGAVESWVEVTDATGGLVSFERTITFVADGTTYVSPSTLRFRSRIEVEASLASAGFEVVEVRDAPDRPGCELVFVARRPDPGQDTPGHDSRTNRLPRSDYPT